jgi:phosphoglycerol transferase MdoB-like AlkP superfamily enzyme
MTGISRNTLFLILLKQHLFFLLLFTGIRGYFIYLNMEGQDFAIGDTVHAFMVGLMVDSSVSAFIILFALVLSWPFSLLKRNFRIPLLITLVSLGSLTALIGIIDCHYYKQFGSHLTIQALELFHDKGSVLLITIRDHFPIYRVLLVFALIAVLFIALHKRFVPKSPVQAVTWKHFLLSFGAAGIFTFLYIGPPFWDIAVSPSSFINSASLNGTYTLAKSIEQNKVYKESIPDYHLSDDAEAIHALRELVLKPDETFVEGNVPTLRRINTGLPFVKKNIVIVIMESFGANYIGRCNEGKGFSPQFDELSKEGVFFTSCRSNGPRSQHGIISLVSGFPAIQGVNLQRRKGVNKFETLGNVLHQEGYKTQFIHNGDAGFDDMNDFFSQGGFERIVDINDFKTWKYKNEWGVSDEDLYERAYDLIWSGNKHPALSVLMTVSNHFPNEVPADFIASHPETKQMEKRQISYYYSDYALGKFMRKCKEHPEYKNTLFLILADHGEYYVPEDTEYKIFHIPALLLNSTKGAGVCDKICSQCDFGTTLLHDLHFPGAFHFIGQDIFSQSFKPVAFSKPYGNEVLLNIDGRIIRYYFETKKAIYYRLEGKHLIEQPAEQGRHADMEELLAHYLQSTSCIFRNGSYHLGAVQ